MSAPATFALPPRLDLSTAATLADDLRARIGGDLSLDAAELSHLGTPGLQVLLAARKSWEAAGHALKLENAGEAVLDQLAQFGLDADDLVTGGSADDALPSAENGVPEPDIEAPDTAEDADGDAPLGALSPSAALAPSPASEAAAAAAADALEARDGATTEGEDP